METVHGPVSEGGHQLGQDLTQLLAARSLLILTLNLAAIISILLVMGSRELEY